jgi:hypothetical protein
MPGSSTLAVEVTHVAKYGFWLWLDDEELLVPCAGFPWFRHGTIEQTCDLDWPSRVHLYWPALNVDLSVHSIRDPGAFAVVSRTEA